MDGDYAAVRSKIVTARHQEVPIEYRLYRVGQRWQAYDVLFEGVSFVATYRSQFSRIIQTSSFTALMERMRDKEVEVAVHTPENIIVEMDSVLIQRLIGNLLSNAIDASPAKSRIRIELQQLARTEASRDWLRIKIIDEGEGIRRDHLKRILKPYFTTKDRGDETRGFGLGLAICRQIVHLHGGNLNIASEEKKGTTVQVDLPSRQINRPMPALALNTA